MYIFVLEEAVVSSSQVKENMLYDLLVSQLILRTRPPNIEHPNNPLLSIKG